MSCERDPERARARAIERERASERAREGESRRERERESKAKQAKQAKSTSCLMLVSPVTQCPASTGGRKRCHLGAGVQTAQHVGTSVHARVRTHRNSLVRKLLQYTHSPLASLVMTLSLAPKSSRGHGRTGSSGPEHRTRQRQQQRTNHAETKDSSIYSITKCGAP